MASMRPKKMMRAMRYSFIVAQDALFSIALITFNRVSISDKGIDGVNDEVDIIYFGMCLEHKSQK